MSDMKKFAELVSKDENVKKELDAALAGVAKDDTKAFAAAVSKVAAAHGFALTAEDFAGEMQKLSEEEIQAVAGGSCGYTAAGCECAIAPYEGYVCTPAPYNSFVPKK